MSMLALPSISNSKLENNTVLDALPYIDDTDYSEAHRQLALQLIQAECMNYPLTKNYLKNMPEPEFDRFLTPRLKEQITKIENKEPVAEGMDFNRCNILPPASLSKSANKRTWQNAIENCKCQLGNQYLRKINLEIMEQYAHEAHLRFNNELLRTVEKEEIELNKLKSKLYELNSRRKRTQVDVGEKLSSLGHGWVELVTKNARIEVESWDLENSIRRLAKRLKVDPSI